LMMMMMMIVKKVYKRKKIALTIYSKIMSLIKGTIQYRHNYGTEL